VVLLIVGGSHQVHAQFIHPKIKSKETTIRSVVVLPAKVNVVRDSMKGPEGMAAESDELSVRVEKMVATETRHNCARDGGSIHRRRLSAEVQCC
jgi:hypothetical protein